MKYLFQTILPAAAPAIAIGHSGLGGLGLSGLGISGLGLSGFGHSALASTIHI